MQNRIIQTLKVHWIRRKEVYLKKMKKKFLSLFAECSTKWWEWAIRGQTNTTRPTNWRDTSDVIINGDGEWRHRKCWEESLCISEWRLDHQTDQGLQKLLYKLRFSSSDEQQRQTCKIWHDVTITYVEDLTVRL